MSDPEFNPSEVLEALSLTAKHGRSEYVVGRICFSMLFFIPPDGTMTTPLRMVAAEKRVARDFPRDLYPFFQAGTDPETGGDFKPMDAAKATPPEPEDIAQRFMAQNETHHGGTFWYRFWNGRLDGKEPPTQMVTWFYDRSLERASHEALDESHDFQVNIPLTLLDRMNRPQALQKLFADLCAILQPNAAMGGLLLEQPLAEALAQTSHEQEVLYPVLQNHPGLMAGNALNMSNQTRWRMSAVNWLTAVRSDLLELCGGREAVLEGLQRPGIETANYGGGNLLIQAGPSPQMGNVEAGVLLPHYGDVARALRPARIVAKAGQPAHIMNYGPERILYDPAALVETQNAWLSRFDAML